MVKPYALDAAGDEVGFGEGDGAVDDPVHSEKSLFDLQRALNEPHCVNE